MLLRCFEHSISVDYCLVAVTAASGRFASVFAGNRLIYRFLVRRRSFSQAGRHFAVGGVWSYDICSNRVEGNQIDILFEQYDALIMVCAAYHSTVNRGRSKGPC